MEGCTLSSSGTVDSDAERFCGCVLHDLDSAGRTPLEAAEVSDDILHQRAIPSWVRPIFEGCQ
jgi:hypothetical protein